MPEHSLSSLACFHPYRPPNAPQDKFDWWMLDQYVKSWNKQSLAPDYPLVRMTLLDQAQELNQVLRKFGPAKPLWITEMCWNTHIHPYGVSELRQADLLVRLYVLGIAVMYTGLGVGAALTGKAFGSAMTNPWVLGFVALVFATMAASMFGAFELQLPAALQARLVSVGGAGYAGAFAMGLVAGIVAAPCTGPVLADALAFVAAKGSVAFGGGILFVYALGIGLLFFLIGAFSISLPKSGAWMDGEKSFFGVALLAAALLFVKEAVPGLRAVFSAHRHAVLGAALAAGLGVLLGALQGAFQGGAPGAWRANLRKGAAVALVVLGLVYALGSGAVQSAGRPGCAGASGSLLSCVR